MTNMKETKKVSVCYMKNLDASGSYRNCFLPNSNDEKAVKCFCNR